MRGRRRRPNRGARQAGEAAFDHARVLEKSRRERAGVSRRLLPHWRQSLQRRRGLSVVRRARRRCHHVGGVSHRAVRSGERAARASLGDGIRRGRESRCRSRPHREGVRPAASRGSPATMRSRTSSRSIASASPRPTSIRARSNSSTICRKPSAAKFAASNCASWKSSASRRVRKESDKRQGTKYTKKD